ncbi:MAG: hypothetical protein QM769_03315 [Pseudoxanthomonas sp.]
MSSRSAQRLAPATWTFVFGLALAAGTPGPAQAADAPGGVALESECVLELRGGTTIRAQVLEYVPGSHVMLRAFDGQTFRLQIEDVLDIRHPGDGPFPPSPACERIARAVRPGPRGAAGRTGEPSGEEEPPRRPIVAPPIAAPPVAAPPASGPPVTLETNLPRIELQIADGVKANQTSARRGPPQVTWEYVWKKVCDAPCGQRIGEEGVYRVDGYGVRPTAPFRLDALGDGPFHLKLRLGPAGMYRSGIGSIVLGVLSSLGGAALLIAGGVTAPVPPVAGAPASYRTDYQNALDSQRALFISGGVLLGTGLIGTVAGALLMRHGKSQVTVERPRRAASEASPRAE